ncbi:hypothetical protein HS088_TW03G01327 [Tripterygium wilfordii]|uniref:Ribosomal protein S24e family protein n=1 Tax=Tripterygium wilfordii TaxID=458696 RepID=A0A7J7DY13_TRIWF|nr:uncharacterized protein LOC119988534 [Tripterygium wilfordii]KAF5750986.1 hypothetical protein HS088_TW03G01327 [Tripterygium wilfordii]
MSLLGNAIKWSLVLRTSKPNHHSIPSFLRQTPKGFCTEMAKPSPPPPPSVEDASADEFLKTPKTGLVYGKLSGIRRNALKSDILYLIDGCNLTPDDIKVNYTKSFMPVEMIVQFPSRYDFDKASRLIPKKSRFHRLDKADRSLWDLLPSYDGKTVLLQGIPRNAIPDDVERFLSGCDYDASSFQLLGRSQDSFKMAMVRFPTQTQAMNAFITKNRTFCLNNQISVRVLQ